MSASPATLYAFDPAHCSITFIVRHIFVNVPGRFSEFDGTVRFDPQNLEGSLFNVTVQAASLDTYVEMRNNHLRSVDFFDVANHPDIRFKSTEIKQKSGSEYLLKGTLTLKGISREVEVPLAYFGKKGSPMDAKQEVAGFATKLDVFMPDYSFCDSKWSAMGVIGQHAALNINFELLKGK
jgi:Uncharacterized conserved protein